MSLTELQKQKLRNCINTAPIDQFLKYFQSGEMSLEDVTNISPERKQYILDKLKSMPNPEEQREWAQIEMMLNTPSVDLLEMISKYIKKWENILPAENHVDLAKQILDEIQKVLEKKAEQAEWNAVDQFSMASLIDFLSRHPNTPHKSEIDDSIWGLVNPKSVQDSQQYLSILPQGKHSSEARNMLDAIVEWNYVKNSKDIFTVTSYIRSRTNSPFKDQAQMLFQSLKEQELNAMRINPNSYDADNQSKGTEKQDLFTYTPSRCGHKAIFQGQKSKSSLFSRLKNACVRIMRKGNDSDSPSKNAPLEYVNSCVYAPAEAKRDDDMMVQIYLYRNEETGIVEAKAKMVDETAVLRQYKPLDLPIKMNDNVRIQIKALGAEIENDTKSFIWLGTHNSCEFSVYIPGDYSKSVLNASILIFINNLPAAEMTFKTAIVDAPKEAWTKIDSHAFEKIFISYSHTDILSVRPIVEGLRIANKEYFFDRHTLKAGDKFRDVIKKWIDTADVFVLCWSKNAAKSIEVCKEKDYALEVLEREDSHLHIYPLSISPKALLPDDMIDTYNFAQLTP